MDKKALLITARQYLDIIDQINTNFVVIKNLEKKLTDLRERCNPLRTSLYRAVGPDEQTIVLDLEKRAVVISYEFPDEDAGMMASANIQIVEVVR